MEVTIKCASAWLDLVIKLMDDEGLIHGAARDGNVLHFPVDDLYRDVDRFLYHCQAIGLIRDWSIARFILTY